MCVFSECKQLLHNAFFYGIFKNIVNILVSRMRLPVRLTAHLFIFRTSLFLNIFLLVKLH